MNPPKLFMLLLGCTPKGRHTEQHDIFFGIAPELKDLKPEIEAFWPEAEGKIHIDAWREVNYADDYLIQPVAINSQPQAAFSLHKNKLFFLNLGGYKLDEFDEYHYKLLTVAPDTATAIKLAKQTAFYKHFDVNDAHSHIDDKYGVDVDDLYEIQDILPAHTKMNYRIQCIPTDSPGTDKINIGYFKLSKL